MTVIKPVTPLPNALMLPRPVGANSSPSARLYTDFLAAQSFAHPLFEKGNTDSSPASEARLYAPSAADYMQWRARCDERLQLAPQHGESAKLPRNALALPNHIVPAGEFPDPTRMPAAIHSLIPDLEQGYVYCQACYVEKDGSVVDFPESVLIALIDIEAKRVAAQLDDVDSWAEWHSYFTYSRAVGRTALANGQTETLHEFRLELPAPLPILNKIHAQVRVTSGFAGSNWQATAHLDANAQLTLHSRHIALLRDDLSWTVYDLGDGRSILVYQILTRPKIPVPPIGKAALMNKITADTINKANPRVVQTVANRAVDPTWTKVRSDHPGEQNLGHPYRTNR